MLTTQSDWVKYGKRRDGRQMDVSSMCPSTKER